MIDPRLMCRQHLLGEHKELHMLVGSINKGISLKGYTDQNLLEPSRIRSRHNEVVREMKRRGYNHKSPLPSFKLNAELRRAKVDREEAEREIVRRCPHCVEWRDALASD